MPKQPQDSAEHGEWTRVRDSLKTRWVASVVAFWISVAVLLVVFLLHNELNLILVSISLGLMIIGLWLKTLYQLHIRRQPRRH